MGPSHVDLRRVSRWQIPYMFFNALIQVSACVADIIRIAQITLKMVYNALSVHKRGFAFFWLDVRSDLSTCVHGMVIFSDFST